MTLPDDKAIEAAYEAYDDVLLRNREQFEIYPNRDALRAAIAAYEAALWQPQAARDVLAERERQKFVEGWLADHDDHHFNGEMALAAAAYAIHATDFRDAPEHGAQYRTRAFPPMWPWHRQWWKPKDPRRDLVRAGALILAEIERLDRLPSPPKE